MANKNITLADLEGVLEFAYQEERFAKWGRGKTDASEIAYEYLKSLPDPEPKRTYVLFGSEATQIVSDEDIFALAEEVREGDTIPTYEVHVFDDNTNLAELLYAANGWQDYAIITRSEYLILKLLGEGENLLYKELMEILSDEKINKDLLTVDLKNVEPSEFSSRCYFYKDGIIYPK
jgi:hypothetical protein